MFNFRPFSTRERVLLLAIVVLAALLASGWQPGQAATDPLFSSDPLLSSVPVLATDEQLLNLARELYIKGDYVTSTVYLFAYMQKNPYEYAYNIGNRRTQTIHAFQALLDKSREFQDFAREVERQLVECERYPCTANTKNISSLLDVTFSQGFPSDMVKICEGINYRGKCSYLTLGEYTRWSDLGVANDSVSSLMVGDNVEVLLCSDYLSLTSNCVKFTGDDSNLANNTLPSGKSSIDNRVSTARVTLRTGKGITTMP